MEHTPMTPFDLLTCSDSTRMLKLMLPFIPPANQRSLAMLIKVTELQQTIKYFQGFPVDVTGCDIKEGHMNGGKQSIVEILSSIKDYLPPSQQESLDSISQIMQMMELFSQMNGTDGFPGGFTDIFSHGFPDGFADMFSQGFPGFDSEGGEDNGGMDESSGFSEDGSGQTKTDTDGSQPDQGEETE